MWIRTMLGGTALLLAAVFAVPVGAQSVNGDQAAGNLPPTGRTISGPGTFVGSQVEGAGNPLRGRIYDAGAMEDSDRPDVCVTVTSNSRYFVEVDPNPGLVPGDADPGDTRTYCFSGPTSISLECDAEPPPTSSKGATAVGQCTAHWRVDQVD